MCGTPKNATWDVKRYPQLSEACECRVKTLHLGQGTNREAVWDKDQAVVGKTESVVRKIDTRSFCS